MTQAKRRLTDMDFSKEGCHVSLVSKKVGGAANGRTVLKLASLNNPEEQMEKEEMITKAAHEEFVAKAVADALEPVQKALNDAQAEIEVFKAEKVAAKENARLEQLKEVMGAENSELSTEFEVLKAVDDKTFDIVIKSKKAAVAAVKESPLFKQVGVSGEADKAKLENEESAEMRIIKSMLNQA